jgi:hypothetical protein
MRLINSKTVDYTSYFVETKSANFVKPQATFEYPIEFEVQLKQVKQKLNPPSTTPGTGSVS